MIQRQFPDPPPPPPFDPNLIFLSDQAAPMVVFIVLAALASATIVLWPIMRALGRRLEGRTADPALRAEVEQLHQRLGQVDLLQARVNELEERLDFAERLLTRGQEAQTSGGRTGRA